MADAVSMVAEGKITWIDNSETQVTSSWSKSQACDTMTFR